MTRSCGIRLHCSILLTYLFTLNTLTRLAGVDASCIGCNCAPCGLNNRSTSIFPTLEKFPPSDGCSLLPPNCTLASLQSSENHSLCIPDCKTFANTSACQGFIYPGQPALINVLWNDADIGQSGITTGQALLSINWRCPTYFPQNLIGFQIRLIDASRNEIIETFDIGMSTYYVPIINQDGFFILYLGTFGSAPRGQSLSCAPLEHSRVLTQNYFGRYIKSDEDWTLKVQVLSLPFKEPMGFISSQSNVMEAPVIKSCRAQKCPLIQAGNLPCSRESFQGVFCLCNPLQPTNVMLTRPGNNSQIVVLWNFEDNELFRESLQLQLFFTIHVNTSNGNMQQYDVSNGTLEPIRHERWGFNLTMVAEPGVTIWAEVRATVMRTVNGRPHNFSSRWSERDSFFIPTVPPVTTVRTTSTSSSSDGTVPVTVLIPVIVLVLIVAISILMAIIVFRKYRTDRVGKPMHLLAQPDVVKRITETVHDIEPLLTPLIENHILSFSSPGYKRVTRADTDRQVAELTEVIRKDVSGNKAFGWFLYAIRSAGFEHLFEILLDKTDADVVKSIDFIIWPKAPQPLMPATASVYISYSRFKKTHEDVHHLCRMLAACSVHVVLDEYNTIEMADNEPQWIAEQFGKVQFVIVILDKYYPLNLPHDVAVNLSDLLDDDRRRRTDVECQHLQGDMYRGRTNFAIPVQFGSFGSFSEVPALLRSATCYRLPHKFLMNHEQFQLLAERVLGKKQHVAVQGHYASIDTDSRPFQISSL